MAAAEASIRRDTDTGLHSSFSIVDLPRPFLPRGAFTKVAAMALGLRVDDLD
jgi:hypothetical protein